MKIIFQIKRWVSVILLTVLSVQSYAQTPATNLTLHEPSSPHPLGATFEWHEGESPQSPLVTEPTSVQPGLYYGFYNYDNGCYSQGSPIRIITNICPLFTVDLTSAVEPPPSGSSLSFHNALPANSTNTISGNAITEASVGQTYYVTYLTTINGTECYSSASPIVAINTPCIEICDNGEDDNGDGLIDEYDPDCSCIAAGIPNISFNQDTNGQTINAGTIVSETWASWGVHISTTDVPSSNYPPMIFDSGNPTSGDTDLGSPNSTFGGPGIGDGGQAGALGENNTALGNVLIISDNNSLNDYWNGGTMVFDFDVDVDIASLEILDIDYGNTDGRIRAYDNNNTLVGEKNISAYGDNSYQKINLSFTNIRKLEVGATNSFSIASLNFCDDDLPTSSIGDFVWLDTNQDGLFLGENGIPNIPVKLYTNTNDLIAETITNNTGYYTFDNLASGQYIVKIEPPSDFFPSSDLDNDHDNDSGIFTLAGNQNRIDVDFGLYQDCIPTISNDQTICEGESAIITASGGISYNWSNGLSNDSTHVVIPTNTSTYIVTVTTAAGCTDTATTTITVSPSLSVNIDYNGSVCLEDDSELTAVVAGGTGPFEFSWTKPDNTTETSQTISISQSGNYSVTITDNVGCTDVGTVFIYEAYEPFIFALNTTICEGEQVTLSVNGNNVQAYQWGANADNATTQSVTVTPGVPATTYNVTVTNTIGCTTVATAEISVDPKPIVSITGSDNICINETTQLSPNTGGTWSSSNGLIASVTNSGLVTGLSPGSAVFTFKSDLTNCLSDATLPVTVDNNGSIIISGLQDICMESTSTLTSSEANGSWSSSNTNIATINSSGVITPIAPGFATINFEPTSADCFGDTEYDIEVHALPTLSLNGPSTICEDDNTYVNTTQSGTWISSDEDIATITQTGTIKGISAGTVDISFVSNVGCTKVLNTPVTVVGKAIVALTGPAEICLNESTTLSPTSGGIWISSNNSIATVSSNGTVTAVSQGTAVFTFIELTNGCVSDNTISVQVNGKPNINGINDNELCIGETTNITPSTGGTWESTNETVATILDDGTITAKSEGIVKFRFTDNLTGCLSDLSATLTVRPKPTVSFSGPTTICIDETTTIESAGAGIWSSTDVSIATISPSGIITGIGAGDVTFIFTSNATGCSSDSSEILTVGDPSPVSVTGPTSICIGNNTTLSPSTGGVWISSNSEVASVTNSGQVTGLSQGTVSFIFDSDTGCNSDPTTDITIKPLPVVSYVGPASICIGTTTTLSPSTGGTWSSSDESVATVDENGIVTAEGFGITNLSFEDASTGCISTLGTSLIVYNVPDIAITGQNEICIGEYTNLTPSSGGTWTSSNPAVATISNTGQVLGIASGTVTFVFSENGSNCVSNDSEPVEVVQNPTVNISGPNTICVGLSTTLSPNTGGSWTSNNPEIASVTDEGIVTGISQGIARFTFASDSGCISNQTSPVIVYALPSTLINGPSDICIDDLLQMLPSTGGEWSSSDETIATIDNNGVATAIASGDVRFTFTDTNTGCISEASDLVTIHSAPVITINGPAEICVGGTTNMIPFSGGFWTALNPSIASIQNNGTVTGISPGQARFYFTNTTTGCVSDTSSYVTVNNGPDIELVGGDAICIGETSQMMPNTGGTWISTNPQIATISETGLISGISSGVVKFRFVENSSNCVSQLSAPVTVNTNPTVSLAGASPICIGSATQLSPSTGGTWESLNPTIASVNDAGEVVGLTEGTAYFQFTDGSTGCKSDGLLSVEISESNDVQITGDSEICAGYITTLSPSTGGIWMSNNPKVAHVSNFGVVTGIAPGIATFTFIDANTGCSIGGTTNPVTVGNCINHDFNVAMVNQVIEGNINTNDNVPASATYNSIYSTVNKPLASIPSLVINPDGTYTFSTNKEGKYLFKVSVCLPPLTSGCPSAYLEINVIKNVYANPNIVSNLEFSTTYTNDNITLPGQTTTINALANDQCVLTTGCTLDDATLSIIDSPQNGIVTVLSGGLIEYTPNPGFIGTDTIEYQVCDAASNCNSSMQLVTVSDVTAKNSIVAADDFGFTMREITLNGNVISNDLDPEGNNLSITQQGSLISPIVLPEGEYYINSDGTYGFTSTGDFTGHLEIIYTVCDDAAPSVCTDATLHLQVFDDVSLKLRVYLEGALMRNRDDLSDQGNPLMRDDLRVNPFTGKNDIPLIDPYSFPKWLFDNSAAAFRKEGPGLMPINLEISDSLSVFSVTGQDAIVDWIYVQIRHKDNDTLVLATRSGLLQRDGDIVDLDGRSDLRFQGINLDSFYVVVKHRNHLGVMSQKVGLGEFVDFTDPDTPTFNFGTSLKNQTDYTGLSQKANVEDGYLALWAGDANSDGKIKFAAPEDDQAVIYEDVLFNSPLLLINYDNAYGYYKGDYDMNGKSKYTNPGDDKNLMLAQLLFYPQNFNLISNYGNFIEQIPK